MNNYFSAATDAACRFYRGVHPRGERDPDDQRRGRTVAGAAPA